MMKIQKIFTLFGVFCVVAILGLSGCFESSEGESNDDEPECEPGETDDCTCDLDWQGTRTCDDDGEWGRCENCVDPSQGNGNCPIGYHYDNGYCVEDQNDQCPNGFYWNGSNCVPDTGDGDVTDGDVTDGDVTDGDSDGDQDDCRRDCSNRQCGNDGCGGSCGECGTGTCENGQCVGGEGQPPRILEFTTDVTTITEGESVSFTVVVTDPDGIDDLIGGSLKDPDGGTYGAFATAASEGAYSLRLSWTEMDYVRTIEFLAPSSREFQAVFFDQSGNSTVGTIEVTLECGDDGACDGHCTDLDGLNNCGACDNSCRNDQTCRSRSCQCPTGETECNNHCTDTDDDDFNCGGCGNDCKNGMGCSYGSCKCPDGSTNLQTDPDNCGTCGHECPTANGGMPTCSGGQCGDPCEGYGENCDGYCVDTSSDIYNCGGCNISCSALASNLPTPQTYDNSSYSKYGDSCVDSECVFRIHRNWPPHQASNRFSCETICGLFGFSCGPQLEVETCYYHYYGNDLDLGGSGYGCVVFADYQTESYAEAQLITSCAYEVPQANGSYWDRLSQVCYCSGEGSVTNPNEIDGPGDYNVDVPQGGSADLSYQADSNAFFVAWTSDGTSGCPGDTMLALADDTLGYTVVDDDDGGTDVCSYLSWDVESGHDYTLKVSGYDGVAVSGVVVTVEITAQ